MPRDIVDDSFRLGDAASKQNPSVPPAAPLAPVNYSCAAVSDQMHLYLIRPPRSSRLEACRSLRPSSTRYPRPRENAGTRVPVMNTNQPKYRKAFSSPTREIMRSTNPRIRLIEQQRSVINVRQPKITDRPREAPWRRKICWN